MKKKPIEERLQEIDKRLANAEAYIERGVNVRNDSFLHLDDWTGRSGHPLWMKNHLVPKSKKVRARLEATLDRMVSKEKDRTSQQRRPSKSRR